MDDPVARSAKQDRLVDGGNEPPAKSSAEAPDSVPIGPVLPEDDGDISFSGGGLKELESLIADQSRNAGEQTDEKETPPLTTSKEFSSTTLEDVVMTEEPLDALDADPGTAPDTPTATLELPSFPLSSNNPIQPDNSEIDFQIY